MLLTSSRMPQSAASTTSFRNSHSVISRFVVLGVAAHVLYGDGHFEIILHLANRFAVTFTASHVYGIGSRSCV